MSFPLTDREIFDKVWRDSIKNVIWYGAQVVVIIIVGKFIWWWAGIVLWAIWALILILAGIQTLFVTLLGIILIPITIYRKLKGLSTDGAGSLILAIGHMIQLIENAIYAFYFYLLFTVFSHSATLCTIDDGVIMAR
jgi:hypothetical protein